MAASAPRAWHKMPVRLQEHKGALAPSATPFWAEPRCVFSAIAISLAVHFAVRLTHWPTLAADDSEQMLFSQHFDWSYRPLFTWLLFAINQVVPPGIVTISVLRYAAGYDGRGCR